MTAGILTLAIGLIALLGWILQLPILASFGADHIPMAPSTALFFSLTGMALTLRLLLPRSRVSYFFGLIICLLIAVGGSIIIFSTLLKIYLPIEHLGFSIPDSLSGMRVGHMSSVTAISFVVCAVVFLLTLSQPVERSKRATIALGLASLLVFTWLLFLFAYLFQTPLMYGGGFIPPSLPAAFAFLFLSLGLLISSAIHTGFGIKLKATADTRGSYVILSIFLLLALSILAGGYLAFRRSEVNFRSEIEQQLAAIAELKVGQLVQWRKERLNDANTIFKNHVFSDLVKRYLKNQTDSEAKKSIQDWLKLIDAPGTYDRISLLDIAGNELIFHSQTQNATPVTFSVNGANLLKTGKVEIQDFYRDEKDKKVYLTIFVPILDAFDYHKTHGLVALRIDPTKFLYPLIEKWPVPSKTSETLIIRRDGNDALFLNNLRFSKEAALTLRSPITNEKMPAVKAALGQTGIVEGVDYRGVRVIADVKAVPDSPWFLVARIDLSEAYDPMKERLWMIVILIGALLFFAGLGVILVWRQQRNSFYREQYKSAEALENSQRTLIAAERLGKVGSWEFDIDTKELIWSEEVCRIHEVDLTFKPTIEVGINFYAPDSRPVIERAVQRAIDHGESFDVELAIITNKNNHRWVHTIGDIDQKRRKIFGFFQDITDRKCTETALRESRDFTQVVMDNLPIGVAVNSVDPSVDFNYMNASFPAIYRTTREALAVADNFWNAVFEEPEFREEMRKRVLEDIGSGFSERMHWEDIPITRQGEKTTFINARNVQVPGKPLMISTVWDISERKHAENKVLETQTELKKALEFSIQSRKTLLSVLEDQKIAKDALVKLNELLEQRVIERTALLEATNKELETFTYSVSHDLKAPLRGIDGYSKLLSDLYSNSLNDEGKHFISTIRRSTQMMSQLIDDLLQYSRLERSQLRIEPVLIKKIIEAILTVNEDEISSNHFSMVTDVPEMQILADSNGIQMALRNLVENAIKFTKTVPDPTIEIKQEENENFWILSVKDNGIGFDMKYSQRIFEIFQRLHRVEDYPGTGIGLAMVKKAMHRMNGRAWAESIPGRGSTFYLEIPKSTT